MNKYSKRYLKKSRFSTRTRTQFKSDNKPLPFSHLIELPVDLQKHIMSYIKSSQPLNKSLTKSLKIGKNMTQKQFDSLLSKLPNLKTLDISDNKHITKIQNLPNLQQLNCAYSKIENIVNLPNLKQLICIVCTNLLNISQIPSLIDLNCENCWSLVRLPYNLSKLKFLNMSKCDNENMFNLDNFLPNMPMLEYLDCSNTNLTNLPNLPNLECLDCSQCPHLIINETNFKIKFPKLTYLSCLNTNGCYGVMGQNTSGFGKCENSRRHFGLNYWF